MTKFGEAYVDVRPNFDGFASRLKQQILGAVDGNKIGGEAGKHVSENLTQGFEKDVEKQQFSRAKNRFSNLGHELGQRISKALGAEGDSAGKAIVDRIESKIASIKPINIPYAPLFFAAGDLAAATLTQLVSLAGQLGAGLVAMGAQTVQAAGSLVSLGAAAGRTASLLAVVPTVATSVGLVAGTVGLATFGLGKALKAVAEGSDTAAKKLAALPPPVRAFAEEVIKLKPKLDELRAVAANNLFPGVLEGLKSVTPLFPVFRGAIETTAKTLGDLAKELGALIGGPLGPGITRVVQAATDVIVTMKGAAGGLVTAFVDISAAASPMANVITKDVVSALNKFSDLLIKVGSSSDFLPFLQASYETLKVLGGIALDVGVILGAIFKPAISAGDQLLKMIKNLTGGWKKFLTSLKGQNLLYNFFQKSKDAGIVLTRIIANVVVAIVNIGKAAAPAGKILFDSLDQATRKFKELTGTASGQNKMREYFLSVVPAVQEFGRLMVAVTGALIDFSKAPGNAEFVKQVREELLPALEKLFFALQQTELMKAFVDFLTNMVDVMTSFANAGRGAYAVLGVFSEALKTLNFLLQLPGVGNLVSLITLLAGAGAAMKLLIALSKGVTQNLGFLATAYGLVSKSVGGKGKLGADALNGVKAAASGAASAVAGLGSVIASLKDRVVKVSVETEQTGGGGLEKSGEKSGNSFISGFAKALGSGLASAIGGAAIAEAITAGTLTVVGVAIASAIGALVVGAAVLAYVFRDNLKTFFTETLPDALSAIPGIIGRFFSETLPQVLGTAFSAVGKFLTTTLPKIFGEAIGLAAGGLVLALVGIGFVIFKAVTDWIPGLLLSLGKLALAIIGFFFGLGGKILGALVGLGSSIIGFFFSLPGLIGEALVAFVDFVVNFFKLLVTNPLAALEFLASGISDLFGKILSVISSILGSIFGVFQSVWNGIVGFVGGVLSGLLGIFINIFKNIWDGVREGWNRVNDATKGALNRLLDSVGNILGSVVDFFAKLPGRVINALGNLGSYLFGKGTDLVQGLFDGARNIAGNVIQYFRDLPGNFLRGLGNIGSFLFDSGKALIQGFINGIKSLGDAVGNAAKGVLEKAANFFPHSPAKKGPFSGKGWTFYSGESVIKDFQKGINKNIPTLDKAFSNLSMPGLAISGASTGQASNVNTTNKSYNLTLNGTVGGWDDPIKQFQRMERAEAGRR